jgi:eukaryotic-like serine/threonine-protein kinase
MADSADTDALRDLMALFTRWFDAEPAERTAMLNALALSNPRQHARLQAMIDADGEAVSLELPGMRNAVGAIASMLLNPAAARPGARFGPWELCEPIGAGGMAQVWLASRSDGLHSGSAAIKLLHGSPLAGPVQASARARFAREGELLARLVHPHVAQLLDAGQLDDGSRYLVLEHVRGERIDRWCDARRLDVEARLRLFGQVCEAVSYAHANLVVHRDLKPANILVTGEGHVKLLDFGVAKLLDTAAEVAADGAAAGPAAREPPPGDLTREAPAGLTPEFAAPEQLNGEPISTATDVYALGVLLFVLLSGRRPYHATGDTPAQLAREIAEAEPQKLGSFTPDAQAAEARGTTPSRLQHRLRGDLAQIVARALGKRPADRYPSVQALADDLARHLHHEPVSAREPHWRYRAARFLRRHRIAAAAACAVLLAVGGGSGAALWQAREAKAQAARAEAVKGFVTSLLDESRVERKGAEVGRMTVADLLTAADARLQRELGGQPDVRDEIYTLLIELRVSQGDSQTAVALAEARVRAAEQGFGAGDVRVAPGLVYLGAVLTNIEQQDERARAVLQRAQQLLDDAGDTRSLTRAQLLMWQARRQPRDEKSPVWENNPGLQSVALLREHYPDSEDYLVALQMVVQLASFDHKRHSDAVALAEELVAATRKRFGENDGQMARALHLLGSAHGNALHFSEAIAAFERARELTGRMFGQAHPDYVTILVGIGVFQVKLKHFDEARKLAQQARRLTDLHHKGENFVEQGVTDLEDFIASESAKS